MIKEAIEKFESIVKRGFEIRTEEINGHTYTPDNLRRLRKSKETTLEPVIVHTLTGIVDLYNQVKDIGQMSFHILNPRQVELLGDIQTSNFNERFLYGRADLNCNSFNFGEFILAENFIVSLMSMFEPTDTTKALMAWCGNVAAESTVKNEDDGISQSIAISSGITTKKRVTIENPITLKPYRTFREVEQPESQFVFRARSASDGFSFALFAADGQAWQIDAIKNIKDWLSERVDEGLIIA